MPAKIAKAESKANRAPRIFASVAVGENGRRRGKLLIYDAIGGWDGIRAKHVAEKLELLEAEGADDLDVHLNTPGGDVFDSMAIYSKIADWKRGTKTVRVDGLAASGGSVIMLAGDERVISPAAMVMIHNPRGFAMGVAKTMRDTADRLDKIRDVMLDVYVDRTGLERKELAKLCDAETWMSAEEAVEKGFATAVARSEERDEDEEEDEDEDDEARFRAVASALFANAPAAALKLLSSPLPVAQAPAAPTAEEKPMPMTAEEKTAFEAAQRAATDAAAKLTAQTAELETAKKACADVLAAVGKPTATEAAAHVAGLAEKAKKADELAAEVESLKAAARQREINALLDEASKAGKLTPARREELSGEKAPAFAKDPAGLKTFLDCLTPVVAKTETAPGAAPAASPATAAPAAAPVAELTDEEKSVAARMGVDEENLRIFKAGGAEALDKHHAEKRAARSRK